MRVSCDGGTRRAVQAVRVEESDRRETAIRLTRGLACKCADRRSWMQKCVCEAGNGHTAETFLLLIDH
jgi:hypothetical protein